MVVVFFSFLYSHFTSYCHVPIVSIVLLDLDSAVVHARVLKSYHSHLADVLFSNFFKQQLSDLSKRIKKKLKRRGIDAY